MAKTTAKNKKIKEPVNRDYAALNTLRDFCYAEAKAKGWHTDGVAPHMGNFCANLHGEVSELWESHRNNTLQKLCDKAKKMEESGITPLTCGEEEIADIIIRALDTSAAFNIDVEKAVQNKLAYNRTRSHRHGGKVA